MTVTTVKQPTLLWHRRGLLQSAAGIMAGCGIANILMDRWGLATACFLAAVFTATRLFALCPGHRMILVDEADPDEHEFCRFCGACRNRFGWTRPSVTSGGFPYRVPPDCLP